MKTRLRQTLLGMLMVMTMFFALPVMSQAGIHPVQGPGRGAPDICQSAAEAVSSEASFISLYYGEDVSEEDAQAVGELFQNACPDAEISVLSGGQPVYYYLVSFE